MQIFKLQNYLNETEISQDLQNGVIYGYLKFPANFSSALTSRILNSHLSKLSQMPNI